MRLLSAAVLVYAACMLTSRCSSTRYSTVDIAQDALSKFTLEKDIAAHVKRALDQKLGPTWHAVVGKMCE